MGCRRYNEIDQLINLPEIPIRDADKGQFGRKEKKSENQRLQFQPIRFGQAGFWGLRKLRILDRYYRHDETGCVLKSNTGCRSKGLIYWDRDN